MKKIILIPNEIVIPLKIKAAKANISLTKYIEQLLVNDVKK